MQLSERKLNGFWKPAAAVMLTLALLFGTGMSVSAESLLELQERQAALEEQKEDNDAKLEKLKEDTAQKRDIGIPFINKLKPCRVSLIFIDSKLTV